MRCPCGGADLASCCQPYLDGEPAPSAEALMRSRYTAFARRDDAHLYRSWHPATRPEPPYSDEAVTWTGLQILEVSGGGPGDIEGTVAFRASYISGGRVGVMEEQSRFARRAGRWLYLDGSVDPGPDRLGG